MKTFAAILAALAVFGYLGVSYICSTATPPVDGGLLAKLIIGIVGACSALEFLWLTIRHKKEDFGILAERKWALLLGSMLILAFGGWSVVETAKEPVKQARACAVNAAAP